ncbi:UAA transporter [Amylocystis lapponica]|nr:UAA transporter [Amylocystis lapponica]
MCPLFGFLCHFARNSLEIPPVTPLFSNALALEQLTNAYPRAGTLITFAQFLCASLHGLPRFVTFTPYPHLRPRRVPLLPYLVQVVLFYVVSLLNNAAFAYHIPMPVHIIFRSGGLVVSLFMGWALLGRRYNWTQIMSVLVVSAGVVLTTLSAARPRNAAAAPSSRASPDPESHQASYATGIALLTLALVLSGFLGVVQDKTYARYGRATRPEQAPGPAPKGTSPPKPAGGEIEPWQESMFYLHFLALPLFFFVRHDIAAQLRVLRTGPALALGLPFPLPQLVLDTSLPPLQRLTLTRTHALRVPAAPAMLALSTLTALLCAAGVHRLAARVSSLAVVLVLVVRKAASLVISVVLFQPRMDARATGMLWGGAALVFAGTVGYALGSGAGAGRRAPSGKEGAKAKEE